MQIGKAQIIGSLYYLLLFLAWVGCCVSFGSELHYWSPGSSFNLNTVSFKYNKVTGGLSDSYSNFNTDALNLSKCDGGGKGFVAMQVFAFLCLMPLLILTLLRFTGRYAIIPVFQSIDKLLLFEVVLNASALFWYFLAVCIWGGTCYSATKDLDGSVTATGFAYVVLCFFFMIFNFVISFFVLKMKELQLGGDTSAGSNSTRFNESGLPPPGTSQPMTDHEQY